MDNKDWEVIGLELGQMAHTGILSKQLDSILSETQLYQSILKKGYEQGYQKGYATGCERDRQKTLRTWNRMRGRDAVYKSICPRKCL